MWRELAVGGVVFALHAFIALCCWQTPVPAGKSVPASVPVRVHLLNAVPASRLATSPRAVLRAPANTIASPALLKTRAQSLPDTRQTVLSRAVATPSPLMMPTSDAGSSVHSSAATQTGENRISEAPPMPLVPPRFEAAYLHNPAPVYPLLSKQLGEQGKVVLTVDVSAYGQAVQVQVQKSSGYPRLDNAAQQAVQQWRFVPARRGEQPVAASVLVPLVFRLEDE